MHRLKERSLRNSLKNSQRRTKRWQRTKRRRIPRCFEEQRTSPSLEKTLISNCEATHCCPLTLQTGFRQVKSSDSHATKLPIPISPDILFASRSALAHSRSTTRGACMAVCSEKPFRQCMVQSWNRIPANERGMATSVESLGKCRNRFEFRMVHRGFRRWSILLFAGSGTWNHLYASLCKDHTHSDVDPSSGRESTGHGELYESNYSAPFHPTCITSTELTDSVNTGDRFDETISPFRICNPYCFVDGRRSSLFASIYRYLSR